MMYVRNGILMSSCICAQGVFMLHVQEQVACWSLVGQLDVLHTRLMIKQVWCEVTCLLRSNMCQQHLLQG